jgi:hypothetical protein
MHDCLAACVYLAHAVDDLTERDQFRSFEPRRLVLVRLAHVYDL